MEQTGKLDALTGLGHRCAFDAALEHGAGDEGVLLAALWRLEAVNKALGYRAGDDCLVLAAHCINTRLKEGAFGRGSAYRCRGNRFAILLPGADGEKMKALARSLELAFEQTCPPWLRELGGALILSWAEPLGSHEKTWKQALALLHKKLAER